MLGSITHSLSPLAEREREKNPFISGKTTEIEKLACGHTKSSFHACESSRFGERGAACVAKAALQDCLSLAELQCLRLTVW